MMKRLLPQSAFARNVVTLMTGTTMAQAISIAVGPILTRLYAPEEFGMASLYWSCAAVVAVIATGRYEIAITLPSSDEDAANIVVLTLKLCLAMCTLLMGIVILFGSTIAGWLGNEMLAPWLYLLPVSVMAMGVFNVCQFWFNRFSSYKNMANGRVQQSVLTSGSNVLLGTLQAKGGMVFGATFGQVVAAILAIRKIYVLYRALFQKTSMKQQIHVAKCYVSHPIHIAPSQIIGTIALQLPIFMMSSAYSLAMVGFFSLAYRLVTLPASLLGSAIGDVYRQEISIAFNERGEFKDIFLNTLKRTICIAIIPFAVLYIAAPMLFAFVFGPEWRVAGEYARILTVAAFFQFVFAPMDMGAVVVGATRYIFNWHLSRFAGFMGLFLIAKMTDISIESTLWFFVGVNICLYAAEGGMAYKLSKGAT